MQITTPSGYVVDFKDETDLTYGDRRRIQRDMMKGIKINPNQVKDLNFTGDFVYDSQDATLRAILKSIKNPDGTDVTGDLFEFVQGFKNPADGDAVYKVVQDSMQSPKVTTPPEPSS
jgi:hypothetical protein